MRTESFSLPVNKEIIDGAILSKGESNNPPRFIFLHGGAGNKERFYDVAPPIVGGGVNVLSFDFSGHGKSTGDLKQSSLKKRVEEAKAIINKFAEKDNLVVCGASMGGYIAIKMLESHPVKTLILFCPALYDQVAYDLPFGSGFTEAIRRQDSWRNTDALDLLETFTGNLFVVMGNRDEVIPEGVINLIMQYASNASRKELHLIPDCPHKIFDWLKTNQDELIKLQNKIQAFIALA